MNWNTEAARNWEDGKLNAHLRDEDAYDRLQEYEQGIVDRAAEILSPDASEADRKVAYDILAGASSSYCYAEWLCALIYGRRRLEALMNALTDGEGKDALDDLLLAADEAIKDARYEIENALRDSRIL
jgi:hypothetical protein